MKRKISALLAIVISLTVLLGYLPFAVCGLIGAAESAASFAAGDTIEFGSYPQSMVTDEALLSALNAQPLSWQSYGYYSGDGTVGSAAPSDYMQYADIVYQGTAYRAVRFSQYRPPITYMEFSKYSTGYQTYPLNESNSAFYQKNKVYWFAYEPLLWRIINPSTGLLIADRIVDAQPYQNVIYAADGNYYCDPSCTIGANDYAHSSVRTWLTGTFCQTAFSAQETACITPTTLQILPYQVVLYDPIEDQTAFLFSCNATDNMYFYQSSGVTAFWANSDRDPSFYAYIQGAQEHHDHPLLRGCQPTSDISHVCYVGQTQMNPSQFAGIRPGICIDLEQYALLQSTAPDEPDTATLDALMDDAVNVTRALYTDASLAALDAAFAAAALASNSGNQTQIDEAASALQIAINNLEYRSADETALQDALARAAEIDRSLYTDESLAALDDAVAAAPANANITQQAQVTTAAEAITAALNGLQYKAADETALQDALARAAEIDRSLYTDESLAALDDAVAAAPANANITQQAQVTTAAEAITAALNGLQYKAADETALQDALARAAEIDRSLYTDESLAALDDAVAAAPTNANITQQAQVTAAADAIVAALNNLSFRPADYSELNRLIGSIQTMDLTLYSDASVAALNSAIRAVDYSLNCTQQAQVDTYYAAIEAAMNDLKYAPVVLRHDVCGVIVSGTTREIDLATLLSVQMVDPAAHEGSNFAVGGTIKHLSFYDINLLLAGQVVQPRDTVTVKIKLADDVDPAKCKVYHVTDDLVNPLVRFTSTIDGNYIVFETDHFSEFAVIEVETVAESISVTQLPAKTVYMLGEAFDPTGLRVTLHYSDGTNTDVFNYDLSAVSMDTLGSHMITVYYTSNGKTLSAQFSITVISSGANYQLSLRQPSVTALRYGETLMLYTVGDLPRGTSIKWNYDGKGLKLTPTEDTKCCAVYSNGTGEGNVTAYVVDAAGNTLTDANGKPISAAVKLTSNGSFIQRVVSFFKNLFHVDRRIDY